MFFLGLGADYCLSIGEELVINKYKVVFIMTFYTCFDDQGAVIARCQTSQDIEVLRRMGRPIREVREMRKEESVVCSLTGSPSDYNMDY